MHLNVENTYYRAMQPPPYPSSHRSFTSRDLRLDIGLKKYIAVPAATTPRRARRCANKSGQMETLITSRIQSLYNLGRGRSGTKPNFVDP